MRSEVFAAVGLISEAESLSENSSDSVSVAHSFMTYESGRSCFFSSKFVGEKASVPRRVFSRIKKDLDAEL